MSGSGFAADEGAPVFSSGHIDIDADQDTVWGVMSSIEAWPTWNPDVKESIVHGPLAEGTHFQWKAGPGTIRSTLRAVDRPHLLGWTGKTLGIPAIHVYRVERSGSSTRVFLEESWDGILARLFRRSFQRTLDDAVRNGLAALKAEAERVAVLA